jgi:hypothetical protein
MKAKRKKFTGAPCQVKTIDDICDLKRDGVNFGGKHAGWLILNGTDEVCITNQETGNNPTGSVDLSFNAMKKIAEWFLGAEQEKK